jgi:4-amino-4-deoxy-L-arabinose transferase-like glycosyltransferase
LGELTVNAMSQKAHKPHVLGPRWPLLLLLVLLLAPAGATALYWSKAIGYPYALENGEGFVLDSSLQVAEGRSPYNLLDDYPLTVGNYPPLYYWLNGIAIRSFGLSFAPGRLISALAALAVAGLLGYTTASLSGEPLAGALAALYYLSHPTVLNASALARVDTLAGALAFGGFVAALRLGGRSGLWAAAALFALGLATKHSAVVAPAAACVGLAVREPRRGVTLAGLTAALTAGWIAAGLALYGPVMLKNLGPYTATPIEASRILDHLAQLPKEYLPGLVALPLATVWAVRRGGPPQATSALYGWCALATLATLGKHGSSLLYLSELTIALSLALGLAAGWGLQAAGRMRPKRGALAVAAGCLVLLALRTPPPRNPLAQPLVEARALATHDFSARAAEDNQMLALLKAVKGPLLVESPDLALAAGKPVLANPFILKWSARMGLWDERRLIEDLARHFFAAVQLDSRASYPPDRPLSSMEARRAALTRGRFSLPVLEAIELHYVLSAELARGALYRPRPSGPQKKERPRSSR